MIAESKRNPTLPAYSPDWQELVNTFLTSYHSTKHTVETSLPPSHRLVDFSPQHVEQLLNQCNWLIDRSLTSRSEFTELASRRASAEIDVEDYLRIDEILEKEVQSGSLSIEWIQSFGELTVASQYKRALETQQDAIRQELSSVFSEKTYEEYNKARINTSRVGGLAVFEKPPTGASIKHELEKGGELKTVEEILLASAQTQARIDMERQLAAINVELRRLNADIATAEQRRAGLDPRASWDYENMDFRLERIGSARKSAEKKIRYLTEPGGPLNFAQLEAGGRRRFYQDIDQIIKRLQALVLGMANFYDFPQPLSDQILLSTPDQGGILRRSLPDIYGAIVLKKAEPDVTWADELAVWIRDATSWLFRIQQSETASTFAISLNKLLPDWSAFRAGKQQEFEIHENIMPKERLMRVGSVYLEPIGKLTSAFALELKAPAVSSVKLVNGNLRNGIDQSYLPLATCRWTPDANKSGVNGEIKSLVNALPFGLWCVKIREPLPPLQMLDDLVIWLNVFFVA